MLINYFTNIKQDIQCYKYKENDLKMSNKQTLLLSNKGQEFQRFHQRRRVMNLLDKCNRQARSRALFTDLHVTMGQRLSLLRPDGLHNFHFSSLGIYTLCG